MGRSKVTDNQLIEAAARALNMADLLTHLGLVPCGGNYESFRDRLERLGLLDERFAARHSLQHRVLPDDELVRQAWDAGARSIAQLIARLREAGYHATYRTVRTSTTRLGLDLGELPGQGWRKGNRSPVIAPRPLAELLVAGRRTAGARLRDRLVGEGLKAWRCEGCLRDTWFDGPIPLEVDHISGDRADNRLANLRLLCPNCHALTPTYRGRNIGRPPTARAL